MAAAAGVMVGRGGTGVLAVAAAGVALPLLVQLGLDRLTNWTIYAAVGLLPLGAWRFTEEISIGDLALVAALVLLVVQVMNGRGIAQSNLRALGPLIAATLLLAGGLAVGAVLGNNLEAGQHTIGLLVVAALGATSLIVLWSPTRQQLVNSATVFAVAVGASVMWGLLTEEGRITGLATHPNTLGMTSVLALGAAIGVAQSGRRRSAWLLAVPLVVGCMASGSRAAFVGLFVLALAHALASREWRLAAAGAVALSAAIGLYPQSWTRLAGGGGSAASDAIRRERLDALIESIGNNAVTGTGGGLRGGLNVYLELWSTGGVLALTGVIIIVIGAATLLKRSAVDPFATGMVAGVLGFLAADTFQNVYWERYVWVFAVLTVVSVAAAQARWQPAKYGP